MLVLTRMHNQSIIIGDDITITVVDIGPERVCLGITAPEDYSIDHIDEPTLGHGPRAGMRFVRTRCDEVIVINNTIEILVVDHSHSDRIRLGFKVSPDVPILRKEVYDAMNRAVPVDDEGSDACGAG